MEDSRASQPSYSNRQRKATQNRHSVGSTPTEGTMIDATETPWLRKVILRTGNRVSRGVNPMARIWPGIGVTCTRR